MKFFALPIPGSIVGSLLGGNDSTSSQYSNYDLARYDGAYRHYQEGRLSRDRAARMSAMDIEGSEYRDSLYTQLSSSSYEPGYADLVRGYGREGYSPTRMSQYESQYRLANYLQEGNPNEFAPLYESHLRPQLQAGGLSSLMEGLNFGNSGHDQSALSFLSSMAGIGAPSFGRGASILTQDCGFGGGNRGHGLGGMNLLGNAGRMFNL